MTESNTPQRIVPDKGIEVPKEKRQTLAKGVAQLKQRIDKLYKSSAKDAKTKALIPDVEIYYNAVHYALEQDIFFEEGDIQIAETLLAQGMERAEQLRQGQKPWTKANGLVVRGYQSKIDGSIQPYGLVAPESFVPNSTQKYRLHIWHHGRNNKLSELRFINERQTKPGQFTPKDTFVLHTYGRYCNAMKFAGEIDTFEAIDHAKQHYNIDEDRIAVRGFSMGGAAAWHQAVHYADTWVAATPGAGFAETPIYQNAFAKTPPPASWEQKLWRLYDATECATNLHQCPIIAYSGENDKQKAAADMMAEYMKKVGIHMPHIIGPGVEHKFHPDSIPKIEKELEKIVAKGRNRSPKQIKFTTFTLRYNKMNWVTIDSLQKHWERASIEAEVKGKNTLRVKTKNITAFTIDLNFCPLDHSKKPKIIIDGTELPLAKKTGAKNFVHTASGWQPNTKIDKTLRKTHGLQGPIDDAFLDSFLMVTPTGKSMANSDITQWIAAEQTNAIYQWQMQFRGQPRIKTDAKVTEEDIQNNNLILWGDPNSNKILKKVIDQLPIQWDKKALIVDNKPFIADKHVPVLIYPNPLNPKRYIVINSGFTFAQNGSQSNANQTPKLPDWAIIDTTVPITERLSTGVVACDFFGEHWELI